MINVGDRIVEILKEKNMTQYQLSKRCGLNTSVISTIINKNIMPSFERVCQICKGLDVSLSYFAGEYDIIEDDINKIIVKEIDASLYSLLVKRMEVREDAFNTILDCVGIIKDIAQEKGITENEAFSKDGKITDEDIKSIYSGIKNKLIYGESAATSQRSRAVAEDTDYKDDDGRCID